MRPDHAYKIAAQANAPMPIEHHHTWSEHCIWWLCHQFGALTILTCIFTGAVVLIIIIFRKALQDKIGDFIAWADIMINGKK